MSFDFDGIEPLIALKPLKDDEKFATVGEDRIRELAALDRYERRPSPSVNSQFARLILLACRGAIQKHNIAIK
jgi:hypothetical protein